MEEKHKLSEYYGYIFIAIIIIFSMISYNDLSHNVDKMREDYEVLWDSINNRNILMEEQLADKDTQIFVLKQALADLWLSGIENVDNVRASFDKVDDECLEYEDVRFGRSYYSYDQNIISGFLIVENDKADIVVNRDGILKCYLKPITSMNPQNVSCEELCKHINPTTNMTVGVEA